MKLLSLAIIGTAMLLGGCAANVNSGKVAADDDSYIPTGSMLARKGAKGEIATADAQELENKRNTSPGTLNTGH